MPPMPTWHAHVPSARSIVAIWKFTCTMSMDRCTSENLHRHPMLYSLGAFVSVPRMESSSWSTSLLEYRVDGQAIGYQLGELIKVRHWLKLVLVRLSKRRVSSCVSPDYC